MACTLCLLANPAVFATVEISLKGNFPKYPSGVANEVRTVGNVAYVAIGEGGFAILDVTNPGNPVRIGGYDTDHYTSGLAVAEPYVYLADHHGGVVVLDVSDGARPVKVGEYAPTNFFASAIAVAGHWLYVSSLEIAGDNPGAIPYGLEILDISEATNPVRVARHPLSKWWSGGVTVASNGMIYVCLGYNGVMAIDATVASAPVETGRIPTSGFATQVAVVGEKAYVCSREAGLEIFDVSVAPSAVPLARYDTGGEVYDVAVRGGYAYIADLAGSLEVIDISEPAEPVFAGRVMLPSSPLAMTLAGNHVCIAAGAGGLQMVNVTDPRNPVRSGIFATYWYFHDVALEGDYAYVAAGPAGVQILDVREPGRPRRAGSIATAGPALRLAIGGDYAYVVEGNAGLEVFDIRSREAPVRSAWCTSCGPAVDIAVSGDRAYLAGGESWTNNGLRIIDISNPGDPRWMGSFVEGGNHQRVVVSGGYAYLVDQEGGLRVIDVSFPLAPEEVSGHKLEPFTCSYDVAVGGGRAFFVADSLMAIDARDAMDPVLVASVGSYNAPSIALVGEYALVTDYATQAGAAGGLRVFHVTNAAAPTEVGSYEAAGFRGLAAAGNVVYVANAAQGLTILDLGPSFATAPLILSHPTDRSVLADLPATLEVIASGTLPLSYQWKFNGTNLEGSTDKLLTINNVDSSKEGYYSVEVSNAWGVANSSEAFVGIVRRPVIESFMEHQTVAAGSDVFLEVTAKGTGPFRHVWQFGGTNVQSSVRSELALIDVQDGQSGSYTVIVENLAGSDTVTLALTVTSAPPYFIRQPLDRRAVPGAPVTLKAEARGSKPLAVQWLRNGEPMSGQTNRNLTFEGARFEDGGTYQLYATNPYGEGVSNPAELQVQIWPDISLTLGNLGPGRGNGVAADRQGNVFLTGQRFDGEVPPGEMEGEMFLAKFGPGLELLWATDLGEPGQAVGTGPSAGNKIALNERGDAYVTGSVWAGAYAAFSTLRNHDAFVAKYNSDGQIAWLQTVRGTNDPGVSRTSAGAEICVDRAGNVIIAGSFQGFATLGTDQTLTNAGGSDVFLAKYSPEGELLWARRAGGVGTDEGHGVGCDAENNIYVCGVVSFHQDDSIYFGDASIRETDARVIFLAKCDPAGRFLWATNVFPDSPSGSDGAFSLGIDGGGNPHLAGTIRVPAVIGNTNLPAPFGYAEQSAFMAKYGPNGECIRVIQAHAERGSAHASVINVDGDGNFFVGGTFSGEIFIGDTSFPAKGGEGNPFDGWLAGYDFNGQLLWARTLGGAYEDALHDIAVDQNGRAYVAGFFTGTALFGGIDVWGDSAHPNIYLARVDEATAPTAPRLTILRSAAAIEVSWPVTAIGFELESFDWEGSTSPVTPLASSSNGTQRVVTLPITESMQWFRLTKERTR